VTPNLHASVVPAMNYRLALLFVAVLAGLAHTAGAQTIPATPAGEARPGAVLQGLDKITARISTFEVAVDATVRFGTIDITVRACFRTPPTEPPESIAFLEIVDHRASGATVGAFSGWMFASSPALSAMEHPVYDVWVVDCMKASSADSPNSG
jgi:hypothetical protein